MNSFVVDTNVPIVANSGSRSGFSYRCQLACVEKPEHLVNQGTTVVDEGGLIVQEYARHLKWAGAPGVGDMFFKHVVNNQYQGRRVRRIPVSSCDDPRRDFWELPENGLDPSDRKFLAVAVAADAVILNATDSDWEEQAPLMKQLGVEVRQLCPEHSGTDPGTSGRTRG